jgi:hypothetical protein
MEMPCVDRDILLVQQINVAARELEAVIGSLGVLVRDHLVAIRSLKTATDQLIGSLRDLNFTSTLKDVYRDLNATIRALEDPTRKLNSYTRKLKAVNRKRQRHVADRHSFKLSAHRG